MLEIGSLVDNKYRVLDIVGSGGMSTVYLARNEKANKSWAIKEVLKLGQEDLEIKKNSLIAETEMLKKLNHPNLPAIIDVIETDDTFLVVMDYIEGNDLGDIVKEFGAQPQEKVIEWGKQVCDVLGYLHTRTPVIIYRDLKPANIMLKPDGNITLIDFGTAREAEVKDVANTISLGTRGYAAPEQFGDGARADARTDIYCFGATLYHLVTGHNPAEEPYIIQPIREINPALSGGLEKIILKCTMADPSKRYQDCNELMYDLEHYEEIDEIYRKKQKRKLNIFITMLVMCVLCFVLSIFGYIQNKNQIEQKYQSALENGSYQEAIKLDNTKAEAYNGLIAQVSEDGIIDDKEIKESISVVERYEDTENNGEIVYPLTNLANNSIKDYIEVCFSMGSNLWDFYSTSSTRVSKAAHWFKRILPEDYEELDYDDIANGMEYQLDVNGKKYSVKIGEDGEVTYDDFSTALVCMRINDCVNTIQKYNTSGTNNKSISGEKVLKQSSVELWKQLNYLVTIATSTDDQQYKIVLCNEIYIEIDLYLIQLISYNSLTKESLEEFTNTVKDTINSIQQPNSQVVAAEKKALLEFMHSTDQKIENYYLKNKG